MSGMRRALLFSLLLLFAIRTFADCAAQHPASSYTVDFHRPACTSASPCLQGKPIHFSITPRAGSCYIPLYPGPCPSPYVIDACDTLTWDFGDGTPKQTVTGNGNVDHIFPVTGNFEIDVDIHNNTGTGSVHGSAYVCADPPSYVRFTKSNYEVSESGGTVTVTLQRSGDTSRAFDLDYSTFPNGSEFVRNLEPLMTKVLFGAGETTKTIVHRVQDDNVFTGDSDHSIGVLSDGAALMDGGPVTVSNIRVVEDETGPELSIDDLTVPEGNGQHPITFTIHLSKPATERVYAWCVPHDGTAKSGTDFRLAGSTMIIEPGQTSGTCTVDIFGNTVPGPDKTFTVTTDPVMGPVTVKKGLALCTITNDDVIIPVTPALWFAPTSTRITTGEIASVPLSATVPLHVELVSSDPAVALVGSSVAAPGVVRVVAGKPGHATITATAGELSATLEVEVVPAPRRRATH
jgi:hypothetical protein